MFATLASADVKLQNHTNAFKMQSLFEPLELFVRNELFWVELARPCLLVKYVSGNHAYLPLGSD